MKKIIYLLPILFILNVSYAGDTFSYYADAKFGVTEARTMVDIIRVVMTAGNITSCDAIPESSSMDVVALLDDAWLSNVASNYQNYKVRLKFETATKSMPVGFPQGGVAYDKRFKIFITDMASTINDNEATGDLGAIVEISCITSAGNLVQTGISSNTIIELDWDSTVSWNTYLNYRSVDKTDATKTYGLEFRQLSTTAFTLEVHTKGDTYANVNGTAGTEASLTPTTTANSVEGDLNLDISALVYSDITGTAGWFGLAD